MKKGLLGFLIGLLVVAIVFVVTVLIMASVHGVNFIEEIQSWFNTAKDVLPGDSETALNVAKSIFKI